METRWYLVKNGNTDTPPSKERIARMVKANEGLHPCFNRDLVEPGLYILRRGRFDQGDFFSWHLVGPIDADMAKSFFVEQLGDIVLSINMKGGNYDN